MAAIAEAANQLQAKPAEQPNPDPFARVTAEVVQTFAALRRGVGGGRGEAHVPAYGLLMARTGHSRTLGINGSLLGAGGREGNSDPDGPLGTEF